MINTAASGTDNRICFVEVRMSGAKLDSRRRLRDRPLRIEELAIA